MVQYVIMDIEGTLISLAFVREILFPFAKHRLPSFLHERRHDADVLRWTAVCQDAIEHETGTRPAYEELPVMLTSWIDQDRKLAGLKGLQGMIWDEGYRQRAFVPELYGDVLPALAQWRARGIRLGIYSSGSEQAQRLLIAHTNDGDVTSLLSTFSIPALARSRQHPATARSASRSVCCPITFSFCRTRNANWMLQRWQDS